MSPEQEDFHDEDEHEDYGGRSIFAAGWFRAVLVLTVLAIVVVVALPYLLNWFEPVPPPVKGSARPGQKAESPAASSPAAPPSIQNAPRAPAQSAPAPAPKPATPGPEKGPAAAPAPGPTRPAPAGQAKSPPQMAKASEPVSRPERVPAAAAKSDKTGGESARSYWVQLGLFKNQKNAEALAKELREQGFPVQVTRVTRSDTSGATGGLPGGTYHVVRAGAFADRARALAARNTLAEKGHAGFLAQGGGK